LKKPLTDIHIKIIPHKEHRIPEYIGDYWEEDNGATLQVRATDLKDWRMSMAIIEHEVNEYLLCRAMGIEEPDIFTFDQVFEAERKQGLHGEDDEPGDDPRAPYRFEHEASNIVENIYLHEMGITRKEYQDAIEAAFGGE
jgi:hypothetical protein